MEVVKAENLSKIYNMGKLEVKALDKVNLTVNKGEFLSIVGPSGSGKSTLLHLLGGIDMPSQGRVIIDGVDIYSLNDDNLSIFRRRRIGFIFQFFNLVPVLNTEENILLPHLLDRRKVDEAYKDSLIEALNLRNRLAFLPSQLSGGEQQRVAIARALITKPSIVLADEPTGNLDSKGSNEVIDLLKICAKRFNQTIVMITHAPDLAAQADRIVKLEDGRIKA